MDQAKETFADPPVKLLSKGKERTVGVEFEFSGVEMESTAEIITRLYGGAIEEVNTYKYLISGTELGDFKLELDASLFLNKEYEDKLRKLGIDVSGMEKKKEIEEKIRDMASSIVPFEIVTPPVPVSGLPGLNKLVHELRANKAKGTRSSVFNAFGLHLNPQVPSEKATDILRYIKAFILLEPWIRKDAEIDWSRRMTPYINEYTDEYKSLVLGEQYQPDLKELIQDYVVKGNTRNQSLDLLPVFNFLEPDYTRSLLEDDLTSARPTFHYRLPNCEIGNENWSLAKEWNRWVWVERMAEDHLLDQYVRKYRSMMLEPMMTKQKKWNGLIRRWMENE